MEIKEAILNSRCWITPESGWTKDGMYLAMEDYANLRVKEALLKSFNEEDVRSAMISMNIKRGLVQMSPQNYTSSWIQDHISHWIKTCKSKRGV